MTKQKTTKTTFEQLNPEQRQAVAHGINGGDIDAGPLAIIAGAGSGKTHVLANRVAHLVAHGADPHRILLMTFTNTAAREIVARANATLAAATSRERPLGTRTRTRLPWAGTFHSVGLRLIRRYARQLDLLSRLGTLDRDDAVGLMKVMRQDCGLADRELEFPKDATCLDIYSRTINARLPLRQVLKLHFPWCRDHAPNLTPLCAAYEAAKREQGVLDFDDPKNGSWLPARA